MPIVNPQDAYQVERRFDDIFAARLTGKRVLEIRKLSVESMKTVGSRRCEPLFF